jgi:hypothetical protein
MASLMRRLRQRSASLCVLPSARLGRPGAPCLRFRWWVSPDRPPNPACPLLSTGLSASPAWVVVVPQMVAVHGVGIFVPR